MSEVPKKILVIARYDKVEALRMAAGLTLLDDQVTVASLGELDDTSEDVQLQLESLEFAEVPVETLAERGASEVASMMTNSDVVFFV
ncbi:hypothetical protein [Roseovarius sp.]|uniref:hypothetical protein n=1 Tax=Roseovarius sp. TaxID=1486281 RepID=UPI003569E835